MNPVLEAMQKQKMVGDLPMSSPARWGNGSGGGLGERQQWSYEEWRRVGGTTTVVQVRDYRLNLGKRI
ncbi:unnamed protein product [Linum trigynum]|uniref:Uncharacterized protein n=1 Tax=Linum trigynum TaxID=586398 RepID=A0AAV2CYY4_9ROSI